MSDVTRECLFIRSLSTMYLFESTTKYIKLKKIGEKVKKMIDRAT